MPEVRDTVLAAGSEVSGNSIAEMRARVVEEPGLCGKVVKQPNIRIDRCA